MWKCAKCKEECEDNFDSCWSCGTGRDGSAPPPKISESQREPNTPVKPDEPSDSPKKSSAGLPFGFIAAAAAGWFLMGHREQLGQQGGFIFIIGAVVLGVLSAGMMSRK